MKIDVLKSIPLLTTITKNDLKTQISNHNIYQKTYVKGTTLHNANDSCNTLDIILSGNLVAYSLSINGSSTTIFEFNEGHLIGANLLFGKNHNYPLNLYCITPCTILHINKNAIINFLQDYNFTLLYIKSISQNSQGINQKMAMFTQKSLRENILDFFKQQSILQNSSEILLPMSKKQFADYLGVQRPSLFRELKKLKDENKIEISNRRIKIKTI